LIEFEDVEERGILTLDAEGIRADYLEELAAFNARWKRECSQANVDYVPINTQVGFDKALLEYLISRQKRF
jgi:uncharacterized protein (DUF58 family)